MIVIRYSSIRRVVDGFKISCELFSRFDKLPLLFRFLNRFLVFAITFASLRFIILEIMLGNFIHDDSLVSNYF